MSGEGFTICLWFQGQGEDAARFYASVFKDSAITRIGRYTDAGPGPAGSVSTVEFELNGQKFMALNGGPQYTFNEAVSVTIPCADQAEIDYYWDRLSEGGQEVACGWLKDKYGLFWQIVPTAQMDMMTDPDPEKVRRVTEAMFTMKKLDLAALRAAYAGG
jgi:predicted 3-demethylubiquinone-9 3-methyltransferase (glyoxalase superfamily)